MSTPKKRAPAKTAEPKIVKYDSMRALKIAKSRKTLPRGLKVTIDTSGDDAEFVFKVPGQGEPVLRMSVKFYAKTCLKADGFKLAED